MKIIIEIFLIAVVLFCAWNGYKKGLIMGVGSILIIIISLYMGNLLSNTFSYEASPVLRPFVSGYMEGSDGVIGKSLKELIPSTDSQLSVEDVLKLHPEVKEELCEKSFMGMGIYSKTAKELAKEAMAESEKTNVPLVTAIVETMCALVSYVGGFLVFFIITLIVLTVIGNILNLSFKIPEKDKLNNIGGIVAGAFTGLFFVAIAAWILKFGGLLIPEAELKKTLLTNLFIRMDLLSFFLPL
ncbi:MAG: CvpA family protein [Oscillospiraceae bacterium]